jgi:hypothetical protein
MITREDYLNALELVDQYHQQLKASDTIDIPISNKTEIESWINSLEYEPSVRLCNALLDCQRYADEKPFKYVEDVNKKEFMRLKNVGIKTWSEFEDLRGVDCARYI